MIGVYLFLYSVAVILIKDISVYHHKKKIEQFDDTINKEENFYNKIDLLNDRLDAMIKKQLIFSIVIIGSVVIARKLFGGSSFFMFGLNVSWIWVFILYLVFGGFLWGMVRDCASM